jgi:hypothetical protein
MPVGNVRKNAPRGADDLGLDTWDADEQLGTR